MSGQTEDTTGLVAADERRRRALVDGDLNQLGELLGSDLVYIHSTGDEDTKNTYLAKLSGELRYRLIDAPDPVVREYDGTGIVNGRASVEADASGDRVHTEIAYVAVYAHRAAGWQLVHWHATKLPTDP